MTVLFAGLYTVLKKNILQLLVVVGVSYGLYAYIVNTKAELVVAEQQAVDLEGDNKQLENVVKDLKEQSPIDISAVETHLTEQGALEVEQAVAIEKVQHEVIEALRIVPVGVQDSIRIGDAVSGTVLNGMWDSYNSAKGGGKGNAGRTTK
jgi:exosome complex RNA-binding protein Csl4